MLWVPTALPAPHAPTPWRAATDAIEPGPCTCIAKCGGLTPAAFAAANTPVPAGCFPGGGFANIASASPHMGSHLVDFQSPELRALVAGDDGLAAWNASWQWGAYDGRVRARAGRGRPGPAGAPRRCRPGCQAHLAACASQATSSIAATGLPAIILGGMQPARRRLHPAPPLPPAQVTYMQVLAKLDHLQSEPAQCADIPGAQRRPAAAAWGPARRATRPAARSRASGATRAAARPFPPCCRHARGL